MFTLNCKGRLLTLHTPLVMGIINATPDSFYAGSRLSDEKAALTMAEQMISEGVDIIDIGGQSTRPDSTAIVAKTEAGRVLPVIKAIHRAYPELIISIDTFYSDVAEEAISNGASIINDIGGGTLDEHMLETAGRLQVPYICMHIRGTPQTMRDHVGYEDLLKDIIDYFIQRIEHCQRAGIKDIIIDPGFGFAKTIDQSFELLNKLDLLHILDKPLLVGLSRKQTIYKTLEVEAADSLNGTTVLNTIALLKGAHILRVHDVKEARQAVTLVSRLKKKNEDRITK